MKSLVSPGVTLIQTNGRRSPSAVGTHDLWHLHGTQASFGGFLPCASGNYILCFAWRLKDGTEYGYLYQLLWGSAQETGDSYQALFKQKFPLNYLGEIYNFQIRPTCIAKLLQSQIAGWCATH